MFIGDTSALSKASGLPFIETVKSPQLISMISIFCSESISIALGPTAIRSGCVRIADRLVLSLSACEHLISVVLPNSKHVPRWKESCIRYR